MPAPGTFASLKAGALRFFAAGRLRNALTFTSLAISSKGMG